MSEENTNNGQWPTPGDGNSPGGAQWPASRAVGNTGQSAGSAENHIITNCPHCNRKLLSTRSIMCNWCGKRIEDPEYLERAAQERAEQDAKERIDIEQELAVTARMGVRGYIKQQAKNPLKPNINPLFPNDKI
jgi:hypothetical protein